MRPRRVAGVAMKTDRAQEKEVLLMLSSLYRLRLRLAAEKARGSRAVTIFARLASIARAGRYLLGPGALRDRSCGIEQTARGGLRTLQPQPRSNK